VAEVWDVLVWVGADSLSEVSRNFRWEQSHENAFRLGKTWCPKEVERASCSASASGWSHHRKQAGVELDDDIGGRKGGIRVNRTEI
jgi:hypothetical protein